MRDHDRRIVLLIDAIAQLGRAGQALGVPADMLAGEVDAGLRAVEPQHLVILLKHGRKLLVEARVRAVPSATKLAHHLRRSTTAGHKRRGRSSRRRRRIGAAPRAHPRSSRCRH